MRSRNVVAVRAPGRSCTSGTVSSSANSRRAAASPCWMLAFTSDRLRIGEEVVSSAITNSTNWCGARGGRGEGLAGEDLDPAQPQHAHRRHHHDHLAQRPGGGRHAPHAHERAVERLVGRTELALLELLHAERLHHPYAADVLLEDRGQI